MFLSMAYGAFTSVGHKISLNILKRVENNFINNRIQLEINDRNTFKRCAHSLTIQNNTWVKE